MAGKKGALPQAQGRRKEIGPTAQEGIYALSFSAPLCEVIGQSQAQGVQLKIPASGGGCLMR